MGDMTLAAILIDPELTSQVVNTVVAVVVSVAGAVALTLTTTIRNYIKAKAGEQALETLDKLAGQAVLAVEGYFDTGEGAQKKSAAIKLLTDALAKNGITLTEEQLDAAIEAAVTKNFNLGEAVNPTPTSTAVVLPPPTEG